MGNFGSNKNKANEKLGFEPIGSLSWSKVAVIATQIINKNKVIIVTYNGIAFYDIQEGDLIWEIYDKVTGADVFNETLIYSSQSGSLKFINLGSKNLNEPHVVSEIQVDDMTFNKKQSNLISKLRASKDFLYSGYQNGDFPFSAKPFFQHSHINRSQSFQIQTNEESKQQNKEDEVSQVNALAFIEQENLLFTGHNSQYKNEFGKLTDLKEVPIFMYQIELEEKPSNLKAQEKEGTQQKTSESNQKQETKDQQQSKEIGTKTLAQVVTKLDALNSSIVQLEVQNGLLYSLLQNSQFAVYNYKAQQKLMQFSPILQEVLRSNCIYTQFTVGDQNMVYFGSSDGDIVSSSFENEENKLVWKPQQLIRNKQILVQKRERQINFIKAQQEYDLILVGDVKGQIRLIEYKKSQ